MDILNTLLCDSITIEKRCLKVGEFVFHKGDPTTHIFTVEKGLIKLTRFTMEGRAVILHKANAHESFAEAALFSDVYHCNAIATIPSQINCFPKKQTLEMFRKDPEKAEQFMSLLANQVRTLRTSLELRNIISAKQRIFEYFLLLVSTDNFEVVVRQSFKELAAELGLAHETFYRALAKLEKENIIKRDGKKIKILQC